MIDPFEHPPTISSRVTELRTPTRPGTDCQRQGRRRQQPLSPLRDLPARGARSFRASPQSPPGRRCPPAGPPDRAGPQRSPTVPDAGHHGRGVVMTGAGAPRYVVIGAGLAGFRAAERLCELGHGGRVTVVGAEGHRPYNRPPLSKQVLAGTLRTQDLRLRAMTELDVVWRLGTRAVSLDPDRRIVRLPGREELHYDGLVIATGMETRHLPGTPIHASSVWGLRTLEDVSGLQRALVRAEARCDHRWWLHRLRSRRQLAVPGDHADDHRSRSDAAAQGSRPLARRGDHQHPPRRGSRDPARGQCRRLGATAAWRLAVGALA